MSKNQQAKYRIPHPMICITETAREMFVNLLSCKELLREGALFCASRRAPRASGHHTPSSGEICSVQLVFGKMQQKVAHQKCLQLMSSALLDPAVWLSCCLCLLPRAAGN